MTMVWYIGIDVSKEQLDVAIGQDRLLQYENSATGIGRLIRELRKGAVQRIVLESTGVYGQLAARLLSEAGFTVCVVQPGRIRQFARSQGQLAKTDGIDARMIARFAEASADLVVYTQPTAHQEHLRALVDRRDQLVEDRTRERNRLEACRDASIIKHLKASIRALAKAIAALRREILAHIAADKDMHAQLVCLERQAGVGSITAACLLAHVPELGTVNRQEIAALAGVAPYNNDSGPHKGTRSIYGGRARVRTALHMAAITAVRRDHLLAAFYARLRGRGKQAQLALIAVSRKLIIRLNTMMAQHRAAQSAIQEPTA